ncbi:hypothetical protein BJ170DRAFT_633806 [Xylariales sp. AK1849]|nr:hypothetical protein BJ170DRAFT_633806 [Xylariales sp. AK1849]
MAMLTKVDIHKLTSCQFYRIIPAALTPRSLSSMGTPEQAEVAMTDTAVPPPAYSAAAPIHTQEQSDTKQSIPDIKPVAHINRQFPPTFNAYYQKKITTTFHLGEHAKEPLYALRTHAGWSGLPGIVLHNGPSDTDPPLAAAGNENVWSKHTVVILPPLPGTTEESSNEFMRTNVSWKTITYPFTIDVGEGQNTRRENFEWRHSRGGEIKELDRHSWGWKLVRLTAHAPGPGGERNERPVGATSDGKEVVAVWARYSGWSLTKAFKFQFLGSGATGEMGERWAVMAVITALRIWYLEWQGTSASGSSAGAAGATAAGTS